MGGPEFVGEVKGGGTSFFFSGSKGGPEFFPIGKGGDQNFFTYAKGGDQKKLATGHHRQTAPFPVKNDSSLTSSYVSWQMTLTADGLIFHKICAKDDIETILGLTASLHVGHKYLFSIISCTDFMENHLISC